ncbi:hypothetical protein BDV12DRAFT_203124 [Aspergillus spectabilis]
MDIDGPALAPPESVIPQLDNPPNRNGLAIGVLSACAVFATICCFLRGYARVFLLRKFQIEEVLVIIAYVGMFLGRDVLHSGAYKNTRILCPHLEMRLRDVIPTQYYVLAFGICYSSVLPALKIGI